MANKKRRKLDMNQMAKAIVDLVTSERPEEKTQEQDAIKTAAAALGRKGGLKGGPARAKALSSKKRSEIARKAAKARWKKS